MADFPFDCVGFDLDGTLVDSAGDLAAAVNHALAAAGREPVSVAQVRGMIGGGARLMLQSALRATGGDERLDELLPLLLDHYDAHIAVTTRPFPGAIDALDALAAQGVTLAVVTNKREHFTTKLLGELGLLDRFATVISGDTIPGKAKPDPAPIALMIARCGARCPAFVGDSIYDVAAAHAAGVPVALFSPGGSNAPGADAVFEDYAALVATLTGLRRARA